MRFISLAFICLAFASCSPKQNNNILPVYSDMSAAEDAGKAK